MAATYSVTGTLTDAQTVELDEEAPIEAKRVLVTLTPLDENGSASQAEEAREKRSDAPRNPMMEVMERIWAAQEARGYVPPSAEEIDQHIRELRGYGGE